MILLARLGVKRVHGANPKDLPTLKSGFNCITSLTRFLVRSSGRSALRTTMNSMTNPKDFSTLKSGFNCITSLTRLSYIDFNHKPLEKFMVRAVCDDLAGEVEDNPSVV